MRKKTRQNKNQIYCTRATILCKRTEIMTWLCFNLYEQWASLNDLDTINFSGYARNLLRTWEKKSFIDFYFFKSAPIINFFYLENEKFLVVLKLNEWGDKNHTHRK